MAASRPVSSDGQRSESRRAVEQSKQSLLPPAAEGQSRFAHE